jgi:hypothetical protein
MEIERYSHVMHLVSHVTGKLKSGSDALDVLQASFPAGTLSGAPKIRAMESSTVEPTRGALRRRRRLRVLLGQSRLLHLSAPSCATAGAPPCRWAPASSDSDPGPVARDLSRHAG